MNEPSANAVDAWKGRVASQPLLYFALGGIALLILSLGWSLLFQDGLERWWHAYLVNVCFFVSISVGALFFVIVHHLTGAAWSVVLRRLAEIVAMAIPWLGVLMLPICVSLLLGGSLLYPWNDAELRASDPLIQHKAPYLNAGFFTARAVLYFVIWTLLAWFFWSHSLRQDSGPDPAGWARVRRWSGPAMIVFAITVNFAAFDWLMSLDPHWFSTIFGVYFFSGSVVGFLALLPLAMFLARRAGRIGTEITTEHEHDVAKLLFGFIMFWAYIAFSQYLLIWYANIPEETIWYAHRQHRPWVWVGLLLIGGHFFLPFFGLMSRHSRRSQRNLLFWSCFVLVMHWIDLYWLVLPQFTAERLPLGLTDLLCFAGVASIFTAVVLRTAHGRQLIPTGDPHLAASVAFHNV